MKSRGCVLFLVCLILLINVWQVTSAQEMTDQQIQMTDSPQTRLVDVGSGALSGDYAAGSSGQGIVTMTYTYSPIVGLSLGGKPVIILQLPPEIADQINGSATKQQTFLSLLTGTVTRPNGLLSNLTYDIHDTTRDTTLAYSSTYNAVYVTFPSNLLSLALLSRWSVSIKFDVATLYLNGITIPKARNGSNYPIKGTFGSSTDGLDIINLVLGNVSQSGIINVPLMSTGTAVPNITAPEINGMLLHLQNTISGKINQTQDSNYTYTVQLTIAHSDGTPSPTIIGNIAVNAGGNFNTNLVSALQYGDSVSASVIAQSKTTSNVIQGIPSDSKTVSWTVQPVTAVSVTPGGTQLSGTAVQTNNGTYQVALQVNGGTIYTTALNANGSFQFSNLPVFQGGEAISLSVRGLSSRTGAILVTSSPYNQTVPYISPVISNVQTIERLNAQGNWEAAASVVTGQTVRYTLTTTLTNQPATWGSQTLKAYIPNGLTSISPVTLIQKSSTGIQTPVLGTQLLTDTGTNAKYWYFKNTVTANNFTAANTSYTLQYTGIVDSSSLNQSLSFLHFVDGVNGGGIAIPTQSGTTAVPVKDGTLRFVQSPTQISFKNIMIPSQVTSYRPTAINSPLVVADGRVTKNKWHLFVRESRAMQSTTTSKTINQAFIYRKSGQEYPINVLNSEVYNYTSADDSNIEISWDQQNGVFLKIGPDTNINANEAYTAQLQWTLSDTPL